MTDTHFAKCSSGPIADGFADDHSREGVPTVQRRRGSASRRRIMAALRLAHLVLGMSRKRLALGIDGLGIARMFVAVALILGLSSATASAQQSLASGTAIGVQSLSIGDTSRASSTSSIAIGYASQAGAPVNPANTQNATAIGTSSRSIQNAATALGANTLASGT